jgi:hypothetical protein
MFKTEHGSRHYLQEKAGMLEINKQNSRSTLFVHRFGTCCFAVQMLRLLRRLQHCASSNFSEMNVYLLQGTQNTSHLPAVLQAHRLRAYFPRPWRDACISAGLGQARACIVIRLWTCRDLLTIRCFARSRFRGASSGERNASTQSPPRARQTVRATVVQGGVSKIVL